MALQAERVVCTGHGDWEGAYEAGSGGPECRRCPRRDCSRGRAWRGRAGKAGI